jgi:hypothetical protein
MSALIKAPSDLIVLLTGFNDDGDTGDDVWEASAVYPFPAAAAATTIISDSADDAAAGTGARTCLVTGLDANYNFVSQVASMNGVGAVTLGTQLLRVLGVEVLTAGSGGLNAGIINVRHGATDLAHMVVGWNTTKMAIYTIPAGRYGFLLDWSISTDGSAVVIAGLQTREAGGVWQTSNLALGSVVNTIESIRYSAPPRLDPGTDLRVRMLTGANGLDVTARLSLLLSDQPFINL